ncbi:hypothetical protein OU798_03450 [Prolixibacteraceae bacterium Z1-6]|uniref:Uncharacterized protein n=1 Tax=Draconibacterium aestuarii TaxID=2998507 RepID=A0A9X3F2M3_9BACT|nr:hypothetical protein [Prolixibacteraceae bacterium Z1-6]
MATKKGTAKDSFRYEQDMEKAELRMDVTIDGNPVEMTAYTAIHDPVMVLKVTNRSKQPVSFKAKAWSAMEIPHQEKLVNGSYSYPVTIGAYTTTTSWADKLYDAEGMLKVGSPNIQERKYWFFENVRAGVFNLKNAETGNYAMVGDDDDDRNVYCKKIKDPKADSRACWKLGKGPRGRPSIINVAAKKQIFIETDKEVTQSDEVCLYLPDELPGMSWAGAHHIKNGGWQFDVIPGVALPKVSGNNGTVCWSGREYVQGAYGACGIVAFRLLDGDVTAVNASTIEFALKPGDCTTLIVAVEGEGGLRDEIKQSEHWKEAAALRLRSLKPSAPELWSQERLAWWKEFWLKSYVDLNDKLMNQYWYGAYYALASCSRGKHECPGLWGGINSDLNWWGNGKTSNYNSESPFYGVYSGNRPELAQPYYLNMLYHLLHGIRYAHAAGYKGMMLPRGIGPMGFHGSQPNMIPVAPQKNRQKLPNDQLDNPAFLAINFINHYYYTLDYTFLREQAYPFMIAAISFYEDYLIFENGRYVLVDSAARENFNSRNCAYALGMIKFLAKACIIASKDLGVDSQRRDKWQHIFDHMSNYPTSKVGKMTVFKEQENLDRISLENNGVGDNPAHLQMIFPAEDIGLDSDPELLQIARNTIHHMNSDPNNTTWMHGNAFPNIFAQATRIGWDADDLYKNLRACINAKMRPNATVREHGGGIETSGGTEAINAMLLQSHEDVLRLFPAWPKSKPAQFSTLRAKGAFLVSSEFTNGKVQYVEIISEKGRDCIIVNPWPGKSVQVFRNGKVSEVVNGARFTLKTKKADIIILRPKDKNIFDRSLTKLATKK